MDKLIQEIKNEAIEITEKINEVEKVKLWLKKRYEPLIQKGNELKQAKDKNSKEFKEEEQRVKKSLENLNNTYRLKVKEELSNIEERIDNNKKYFLEQLKAKMDIIEPSENDEEDIKVFIQQCTIIDQINTIIDQINENFNIENIKKISNSKLDEIINIDMYNSVVIKKYEILKEKYKDDAELSEKIQKEIEKLNKERDEKRKEGTNEEDKERPILTNYKDSRQWTFRDEKGSLETGICGYGAKGDGSGEYEFFMPKEEEIEIRNEIMREYELTEEQANDIDIEALLVLNSIRRRDLAEKYILAFKDNSYDKGFDMCYNKIDTKRKDRDHIKISKEDSKKRDRIAKRHKKLGIAKIIGKSKIKMAVGGILLATGLITAGVEGVQKLNEGQSVPKVESSMKDKKIGVLEGNGLFGGIKHIENGLKPIEIDKSNTKSYVKDKKMGVLEGVKYTEDRLKQIQAEKNNEEISENNFVANPFVQENNIEFHDFMKQNQEQEKNKSDNKSNENRDKQDKNTEKENEQIDETNKKISLEGKEHYGVDKLAFYEIINDMMKPYCKAKVGGEIYEDPTDALRENIGQKTQGKIQTMPESAKNGVYAKEILKYQSADGKYICFYLEDYEKDIKEGNMKKVILDVQNALKKEGLDSNYILNEGTQKVYLLEAPGISQWMKAEDTTMYEFEVDKFGNRIEKNSEEKINDEKAKNNKQNETREEISDIINDYQEDIEEAQEKYSEDENLEAYLKAVKEAEERHNLMMEALQEQMEIEEEER